MVHYLIQSIWTSIYSGLDNSFTGIEFGPLYSPLSVKPGEFVELRTCIPVSENKKN